VHWKRYWSGRESADVGAVVAAIDELAADAQRSAESSAW
jgi:hypothetical protein